MRQNSQRQVVLDTETTGINFEGPAYEGHRVIEIGAIELIDRRVARTFQRYLKPDRPVEPGAQAIHGITTEFLADKPRFAEIVPSFIDFIRGAELIIHNASFDLGFLNAELRATDYRDPAREQDEALQLHEICSVVDTLALARARFPGRRNTLDALCKRFHVDASQRSYHGALLDAHLLVQVYLAMTGGQVAFEFGGAEDAIGSRYANPPKAQREPISSELPLVVLRCSEAEAEVHQQFLDKLEAESGECAWTRVATATSGATPC